MFRLPRVFVAEREKISGLVNGAEGVPSAQSTSLKWQQAYCLLYLKPERTLQRIAMTLIHMPITDTRLATTAP